MVATKVDEVLRTSSDAPGNSRRRIHSQQIRFGCKASARSIEESGGLDEITLRACGPRRATFCPPSSCTLRSRSGVARIASGVYSLGSEVSSSITASGRTRPIAALTAAESKAFTTTRRPRISGALSDRARNSSFRPPRAGQPRGRKPVAAQSRQLLPLRIPSFPLPPDFSVRSVTSIVSSVSSSTEYGHTVRVARFRRYPKSSELRPRDKRFSTYFPSGSPNWARRATLPEVRCQL
jgi:hypothetical protein